MTHRVPAQAEPAQRPGAVRSGSVRLYFRSDSAAMAPHAVLAAAGVDYELYDVDRDTATAPDGWYRAVNPAGTVPALELPDGRTIAESVAISLHVAAHHPHAGLLPHDGSVERAKVHEWLGYLSFTLQSALLRRSYPERYTADRDGAAAVKAAALASVARSLDLVDRELEGRRWLAGGAVSVADLHLFMLVYWTRDDQGPAWSRPAIRAHAAALIEVESTRRMLAEQGLPLPRL